MINQGAGQSNALCHSARKMMGVSIGEPFQSDKAHEFFHVSAFLAQLPVGERAHFDVAPDGEPGEQIWIVENEAALSIWTCDWFGANHQFSGIWNIESGDETQESGFSATA